MLTYDTYTKMRELSTIDANGLGEFARFRGASYPKYGFAMWAKCYESVAVQGAPAYFYASAGVPDGRVLYNEDGTGHCGGQSSCVGVFAYNGTVNFTTTANYPNAYGYCWIQTFGLSSASMAVYGATGSAVADVTVGDLIWPSDVDGRWYAMGNTAAEYRVDVDTTAAQYVFNGPPIAVCLAATTSLAVMAAATAMIHSPWCAGAGL